MSRIFYLLSFLLIFNTVFSQPKEEEPPLTRILLVLDGSQSMLAKWESGTKMMVAQQLLSELVDSLKRLEHVEMALRVYGHQRPVPPQDCSDTKLEVPFSKHNASKIKQKLRAIRPKGTTPIAHSLELSAYDFPECKPCRNIIILITDGIESCDGDPCAVSLNLQKQGIILKPFVIGIGLDQDFKDTFDCVGRYYNANNENRFKEVLEVVVSQALNTTTLQVNLLDSKGKPTETDVNMSFYDRFSNELLYNFVHTINRHGNPDTLSLDPVPTYRLHVHTLPPVVKDSFVIDPGQHNIIEVNAPQGYLMVKSPQSHHYNALQFTVNQKGNPNTLNLQTVNTKEKYLVGTYDIELFTIPRLLIEDVEIKQGETSLIQIPKPGLVTFANSAKGYGAIYQYQGNELVWLYNLNTELSNQTLPIQPGKYVVISRPKNAKESVFTAKKEFTVISGEPLKIELY